MGRRLWVVLVFAVACDAGREAPKIDVVTAPAVFETEQGGAKALTVSGHVVMNDVRAISSQFVVDGAKVLWRIEGASRTRVTDRALRLPVEHPNGLVVVRAGEEPGESSLWLFENNGAQQIGPDHAGADDMPLVLPDGRIVFVSTRTTVASIWMTDPKTEKSRQLTNVGLRVGRPLVGFVPTPAERFEFSDGRVRYDAGGGEWWSVDPITGQVTKERP